MVRSLGALLTEGTEHYCSTTNLALGLFDLLRLRKPKQANDKEHCLELLTQLDAEQQRLDKDNETTYYYHWMKARYHLHAGELLLAISCYKLAFELVLYRQGENAGKIITEAITASCRCAKPDKSSSIDSDEWPSCSSWISYLPNIAMMRLKRKYKRSSSGKSQHLANISMPCFLMNLSSLIRYIQPILMKTMEFGWWMKLLMYLISQGQTSPFQLVW